MGSFKAVKFANDHRKLIITMDSKHPSHILCSEVVRNFFQKSKNHGKNSISGRIIFKPIYESWEKEFQL
jgi:hypothetical protein